MAEQNLLREIYLFQGLNQGQLDVLNKAAHLETLKEGTDIFSQGDAAKALYFVKTGSVRIHQKTPSGESVVIANLSPGSHFGEMPFVDNERRSATATATEKSEVIAIDYTSLSKILTDHLAIAVHFYKRLAHFLCGRLRITTNDLSFAREKNVSHF